MKKIFIIIILVSTLILGTILAVTKLNLSFDSIAYPSEIFCEEVKNFFIIPPKNKVDYNLFLIQKRTEEINKLILEDKENKIKLRLSRISLYLDRIKKNIEREKNRKNNDLENLVIDTDSKLEEIAPSLESLEVKMFSYSLKSESELIKAIIDKAKDLQKEILNMVYSEEGIKGPELSFSKEEYDFGTVKKGEKLEYDFEFTNTGDRNLIITNTYASCGCTASVINTKVVKPGEKGAIKIVFDTTYKKERQTQRVTVTSNDYQNENKYITIKAYVEE